MRMRWVRQQDPCGQQPVASCSIPSQNPCPWGTKLHCKRHTLFSTCAELSMFTLKDLLVGYVMLWFMYFFLSLSYLLDQLLMALEKECGDVVAEGPVGLRAHYEQIKTVKQMSVVYKGMDMVDVVRTTTCRECLELLELQRLRVHIDLIDARLGIATPSHKNPSVIHFYNPFGYLPLRKMHNHDWENCTLHFGWQLNSRRSVVSSQNDIPSRMVLIFTSNHINIINDSTFIYLPSIFHFTRIQLLQSSKFLLLRSLKSRSFHSWLHLHLAMQKAQECLRGRWCRWCKNRMG